MNSIEHRAVSNSRGRRLNRDEDEDDEDEDNDMSAWEKAYTDERSWESLQEDESGLLRPIDNTSIYHAQYRRRIRSISSTSTSARIQKGLIRYIYVVMDFSRVMKFQICSIFHFKQNPTFTARYSFWERLIFIMISTFNTKYSRFFLLFLEGGYWRGLASRDEIFYC